MLAARVAHHHTYGEVISICCDARITPESVRCDHSACRMKNLRTTLVSLFVLPREHRRENICARLSPYTGSMHTTRTMMTAVWAIAYPARLSGLLLWNFVGLILTNARSSSPIVGAYDRLDGGGKRRLIAAAAPSTIRPTGSMTAAKLP